MTSTTTANAPLLEAVSPTLAGELRRYLDRHKKEVEAMIRRGDAAAGLPAGQRHARIFDGLLSSLFHAVHAALVHHDKWRPVTLAAVGSYGRGALCFSSDLDVRLLTAGSDAESAQPIAEAQGAGGWVVAGSLCGWGDPAVRAADLIVFLTSDAYASLRGQMGIAVTA